ncbi:uncharacterized protein LOC115781660 [Archocentrus centrarchus]|uniref:uncharacterized protein LOC115781660 n=1 Tax=Archocentrus centrarchus TaxID=63155 RepID=UPI0011EA2B5D|nr:uncharacterized protein LOC115781660 [Archocentrus centrarchus]
MPKLQADKSKCSVVGCINPHDSLHRPPASEHIRSEWLNFIFFGNVPTSVRKVFRVCAKHFKDECFSNLRQYQEGFAERLHLIEGSVPSLYRNHGHSKANGFPSSKKQKREGKKQRNWRQDKTTVKIGTVAFPGWKELRREKDFKSDAEVASFLLNSYRQTTSASRSELPSLKESSSAESRQSVCREDQFGMSLSNEAEKEKDSSIQSTRNGKELRKKDASKNEENGAQEDGNRKFRTSLSVGDGRHLVDLGSSSEIIVDEECILQLLESCRECSRQCTVRKAVKGLKLVVYQECGFCKSRCKWTNLPDDDDDKDDGYFQIDGKESANKRSTAVSPRSSTS